MPRDPALALHPAELLGRPYADMAAHHEQLQRHLMIERERFPAHASLVAHHEEYLRFVGIRNYYQNLLLHHTMI